MKISELKLELKIWSNEDQLKYCNFINQDITIATRAILVEEDDTDKEKLEGIKWLNEFHHRVNNLKYDIEHNSKEEMENLVGNANFYARQNRITKNAIANVLQHSYAAVQRI